MAWTVTKKQTVHGNERVVHLKVLTDSAEQTIQTGLKRIDAFSLGYTSMTAITYTIFENKGSTSTAMGGALGCSGFTSGDAFFITVFGVG